MGGWMFFPSDNSRRNWSLEDFLDDFSSVGSQPSRDEWYEHVPESRERLQGRTLGFLGGMPLPEVIASGCGFLQGVEYAAAEMNMLSFFHKRLANPPQVVYNRQN